MLRIMHTHHAVRSEYSASLKAEEKTQMNVEYNLKRSGLTYYAQRIRVVLRDAKQCVVNTE